MTSTYNRNYMNHTPGGPDTFAPGGANAAPQPPADVTSAKNVSGDTGWNIRVQRNSPRSNPLDTTGVVTHRTAVLASDRVEAGIEASLRDSTPTTSTAPSAADRENDHASAMTSAAGEVRDNASCPTCSPGHDDLPSNEDAVKYLFGSA